MEDPEECQTDDLPSDRTEEGATPVPDVDAARNKNSAPEGVMERPSSKAEEETATLPQEEATGNGPSTYSKISHFLRTNLADAQSGAFSSSLVWRASLILGSCWEWRLGLSEKNCPVETYDPVLQSLEATSPDGLMDDLSLESEEAKGPFFTKVVALLEPDSDSLDSTCDLSLDSMDGEGPFFTKVALLKSKTDSLETVLEDLPVDSVEGEAPSVPKVALLEPDSASPLLSAREEDSTDEEDSDGRSNIVPPSGCFPSINVEEKTKEAISQSEEKDL
ncbi:uncharacterized protein LOC113913056 isoform X2 [Zalophus californianus]|uniref:Uncharacterized protein LOC113913056 isoform X2 n=1 Tax=Zalophus californianus TaxID=9704 RepID=A0A6P9FDV5_ZALCA|nr:uncharacterized protein LOC113913056 isoform X2 [Zalophus californianus]